jgi:23S rRNA (cytidine2498-2'-O)-methyltransferase
LQLLALDRTTILSSAASPAPLPGGGFTLAPWPGGAAPVAIDRAPPSRAYQKLEEAFLWMNAAPGANDVCVDLGAAPGGWTMTALKRGARVIAVDRAPLEPPAAPHPRLTMKIGSAFTFEPPQPVDWLLCDVICEPPRSIALIENWLARRWCRHLVCTIKFKGTSGYGVLSPLAARLADAGLRFARIKQLAHNKNEVTVMGLR